LRPRSRTEKQQDDDPKQFHVTIVALIAIRTIAAPSDAMPIPQFGSSAVF
jgi:hypothetical protein